MNRLYTATVTILCSSMLFACSDETEQEIAVSDVPPNIIKVVQNTLPGISLTEAEKEICDDSVVYELEGRLINGKEYEIEISETGTILKIELEQ